VWDNVGYWVRGIEYRTRSGLGKRQAVDEVMGDEYVEDGWENEIEHEQRSDGLKVGNLRLSSEGQRW
jgi:hypothetical protein